MSFSAIIFDWDGTLVDSEAHIVACITHAAEQMALPALSYQSKKSIIGLGMREALLELYPELDEAQVQGMRKHYSEAFFDRATTGLDLFPGVIETFESLRDRGMGLAVATGKSRNGLEKALDSSGLRQYFDIERCADETRSKPHPMMLEQIAAHYRCDAGALMMVGDTTYDMEMASAIDMPAVAVDYGVHDTVALKQHSPKKIISHLGELLSLI